jgi:hypothetical protein
MITNAAVIRFVELIRRAFLGAVQFAHFSTVPPILSVELATIREAANVMKVMQEMQMTGLGAVLYQRIDVEMMPNVLKKKFAAQRKSVFQHALPLHVDLKLFAYPRIMWPSALVLPESSLEILQTARLDAEQ